MSPISILNTFKIITNPNIFLTGILFKIQSVDILKPFRIYAKEYKVFDWIFGTFLKTTFDLKFYIPL